MSFFSSLQDCRFPNVCETISGQKDVAPSPRAGDGAAFPAGVSKLAPCDQSRFDAYNRIDVNRVDSSVRSY